MSSSIPRNTLMATIPAVMLAFCCTAPAAELDLSIAASEFRQQTQSSAPGKISFQQRTGNIQQRTRGIDKYRVSKGLKVRGWHIGDKVYFGQAKVGKKWGVGVIIDRGQYVYGINNRGIQLLRRL